MKRNEILKLLSGDNQDLHDVDVEDLTTSFLEQSGNSDLCDIYPDTLQLLNAVLLGLFEDGIHNESLISLVVQGSFSRVEFLTISKIAAMMGVDPWCIADLISRHCDGKPISEIPLVDIKDEFENHKERWA